MAKLYLVEMTHRGTNQRFHKVGWCKSYDVLERFSPATSVAYGNPPDQYADYDIRVLASAYGSFDQVKQAEQTLKQRYPKNLWIEDSFSGITEIVWLDPDRRLDVINDIKLYAIRWREQRNQQ